MKPIVFNNTVLRDGHQSLAATRMTTAQMLPAAAMLDELGFGGLETWGGATVDACLRFLHENPFDRLRKLKAAAPKTPHIMLLRGQNLVQYTAFPDDVVRAFVRCTCEAGCDVLRIFDALNDVRNLTTAIEETRKCGRHARGEICFTTSPVHTIDNFVKIGRQLADLGCHSIGIKDMAGILAPQICYELVRRLRKDVGLPIVVHSHDTAGLAATTYYAAVEAGADAIETSIAPFANGTAQPDTVRMVALLENHPRAVRYDEGLLAKLRLHFTEVYQELAAFTSHANEIVDSDILCYQVPGGMLSNFRNQLKEQKMLDKFEEVMLEIPHVRKCLGWVPLVTPTSQIVGTQAMLNVKFGRWKTFAPAAMDIALGKYGRTPGPIDPEVLKIAIQKSGQEPITERPADLLAPRMDDLRVELAKRGLPVNDENAVLFAMFPSEVEKLYKTPANAVAEKPAPQPPTSPAHRGEIRKFKLTVKGHTVEATVEEIP
jgi:oxaloacetate decarboxylase alpha subunit/pyruvate carboxylase subunit B